MARAVPMRATSPACTTAPPTGDTWAGVSLPPSTTWLAYVYAAANAGIADPGNIFYIRSTDSGMTFSAPFQLTATPTPTNAQWQPNLSVSQAGTLLATWYDERHERQLPAGSPATPCYQMLSRKSNDNGVTWLADDTLSDVVSPLPLQPDPGIEPL